MIDLVKRKNKQKRRERYIKKYYSDNRDIVRAKRKEYRDKIKDEAFAVYGKFCHCKGCNENRIEFLTIEHKNGRDQTKPWHRRKGIAVIASAKVHGWPDDLTILCYNCNCSKGNLGYCPHEKEVKND